MYLSKLVCSHGFQVAGKRGVDSHSEAVAIIAGASDLCVIYSRSSVVFTRAWQRCPASLFFRFLLSSPTGAHRLYCPMAARLLLIVARKKTGQVAIMIFIEVIMLVGLYFVPAIIAKKLHLKDASSIFYVNLVFGWTVLGWVLALTWVIAEWIENRRAPEEPADEDNKKI